MELQSKFNKEAPVDIHVVCSKFTAEARIQLPNYNCG